MRKQWWIGLGILVVGWWMTEGLLAGTQWLDRFSIKGDSLPPWYSAMMVPLQESTPLYLLDGYSSEDQTQSEMVFLALWDAKKQLVTAAFLDPGQETLGVNLYPSAGDTFCGTVIYTNGAMEVAVFDRMTRDRKLGVWIPPFGDPEDAYWSFMDDSLVGALQATNDAVKAIILNVQGQAVIDQVYQSSDFQKPSSSDFGLPASRWVDWVQTDSGYLLSVWVVRSTFEQVNPPSIKTEGTLCLVGIRSDGSIQWKKKWIMPLKGNPVPFFEQAPDGTIYVVIPDHGMDLLLQKMIERTYLLKLLPNGSLQWAKLLDDISVQHIEFGPNGEIWLGGSTLKSVGSFLTDAAIVKMNPQDGSLDAQAKFVASNLCFLYLTKVTPDRVYAVLNVLTPSQARGDELTSSFLSLNQDLSQVLYRTYGQPVTVAMAFWSDIDQAFLFTTYRTTDHTLDAISVPADFQGMLDKDCPPWTDESIAQFQSLDLSVQTPQIKEETLSVITHAGQTEFKESTLELKPWQPHREPLCGESPSTLQLTLQWVGKKLELRFPTEAGKQYRILRAITLPGPFQKVAEIPGTGQTASYEINPKAAAASFYRVQIEP